MTLHEQRLVDQGMDPAEAYEQAVKMVYPQRSDFEQQQLVRASIDLQQRTRAAMQNEFERQDLYQTYGIPEGTPPGQAMQMIQDMEWPGIEAAILRASGGQQRPEQAPSDVPSVTEPTPDPAPVEAKPSVSAGQGLGAIAREMSPGLMDLGKTAFFPPWRGIEDVAGIAQGVPGFARDIASGWRAQGEGIDPRLLQEVSADIASEGEEFVRAELQKANVPPEHIDRIIEAARR